METNPLHRKTNRQCCIQFAARNDVRTQSLIFGNTVHLLAGKRLGGIADHTISIIKAVDRITIGTHCTANGVFIHDVQRSAVFLSQLNRVHSAEHQVAFIIDLHVSVHLF